jgi:hypothetical protein
MRINNPFETYSRGMTARERRIRSRWALMFVMSSLIAVWSTVKYYNEADDLEKERGINTVLQTQTVGMTNTINSLKSELFVSNVQLQRWEWAFENFKEREPKPAQRFELIYNHETE